MAAMSFRFRIRVEEPYVAGKDVRFF